MKYVRYVSALVILLVGLLTPAIASAHVLKQGNGVSCIMHIAPFDAPVSAEATNIEFQFSGAGSFSLNDYAIQLDVLTGGKRVATLPITAAYFGTSTLGAATVTFPAAAVYDLRVIGTPTSSAPKFELNYTVRVTAGSKDPASSKSNNVTVVTAVSARS